MKRKKQISQIVIIEEYGGMELSERDQDAYIWKHGYGAQKTNLGQHIDKMRIYQMKKDSKMKL